MTIQNPFDQLDAAESNPYGLTLFPVDTPSGGSINLQTQQEADYYMGRCDQYVAQNKFTNISDVQDLDRLLVLETMVFRWSFWISQGFDYMFARVDENMLKTNIRDYSIELRLLKTALGIDKVTRDREKGESITDYVETLKRRAGEFGIHRNKQYETAVTMIYHLRTLVTTFDRCDDQEREELDLTPEAILDWIRTNMIPKWDAIDASFRKSQKIWIHELS